jgi:peptidoglycan hydrolase CwlO-like protein
MTLRRGVLLLAAVLMVAALSAPSASPAGLHARERTLKRSISADNARIGAYEGRLRDLQARLAGLQSSLAIQQALLARIDGELRSARARLVRLRAELARDRQLLADQLVSQYESPQPDVVAVALQADGFAELLERVDQMRLLAEHNAQVVALVAHTRAEVAVQARELAVDLVRQRRVTASVEVERDQVANLRLEVLRAEHVTLRDRARHEAQLRRVRHQLAVLRARAVAAERAALAASSGGASIGFAADAGMYGFFPAPGTNYSVGSEPTIAARLDRLGKALHLHLIGLSGYRTPQHSVEVGGFADDPHTRGQASDTPGVEGVPESVLLQFGLTRPFAGPAEADHIQLA